MSRLIFSAAFSLLFLFLSPLSITSASNAVLDISGRPLRAGSSYYILPVVRGRGGGLTMSPKNTTQSCPLYVAQQPLEVSNGLPIKFFPVNPKQKTIPISTDVNVVFDASTICVQSTGWSLTIDEVTRRRYVATGGEIGNPGVETVDSWFKIEKGGSGKYDYKMVFCPSVCNFCKVMCSDLGVFIEEDGERLLGFSDQPLSVMFKKV